MSPTIKMVLGGILLVIGIVDLLKFGLAILFGSPMLVLGILLTAGGAAMISSGRQDNLLK